MDLSHGCCRISHITQARSRTGCNEALLFRSYTLVLCSFALAFRCRFPRFFPFPFLSRAFRFPGWRRTKSNDLISRAGSCWSTLLSLSCVLTFRFDIRCFVTLRTSIPVLNHSLKISGVPVR